MQRMIKTAAMSALVLFNGLCFGQQPVRVLSFSAEDDKVSDMVQVPDGVLQVLLSDEEDFPEGQQTKIRCEDHERHSNDFALEILCRKLPSSAQGVDLYLVIGVGGLRGAHILPFWIIRQDASGASLLFKTRSDVLTILPKQFNGFPEVVSSWIMNAGANFYTDSFRFNGKTYARYHHEVEHQ